MRGVLPLALPHLSEGVTIGFGVGIFCLAVIWGVVCGGRDHRKRLIAGLAVLAAAVVLLVIFA